MSQQAAKPIIARLERERQTVAAMIGIYCADHHGAVLCRDCRELAAYASCRLDRCPFGADKPTCARCPIHCYKPEMRQRIRAVMRYAGPRMAYRHPWLALRHWMDGLLAPRPDRTLPKRKRKNHATPADR